MTDLFDLKFTDAEVPPPLGNAARFGGRWRLVGGGLFNVWRYGRLDLPAPTGRLLLRGPNGTGKTTALEALWPYLLDLNAQKLAAGKARPTSLKLLMSEGAPEKRRRYGYVWLTFAAPDTEPQSADMAIDGVVKVASDEGAEPTNHDEEAVGGSNLVTFGVRLQFSPSSSPAVKAVPFTMPGIPGRDIALTGPTGNALESEEFTALVASVGGTVFTDQPDEYVSHLAARVWHSSADEIRSLAGRLREIRNPTLLGEVSAPAAAAALRASLPGVSDEVLTATADALAESEATREAFNRDALAAEVLEDFARVWTGHVVDVARAAHIAATEAASAVRARSTEVRRLNSQADLTQDAAEKAGAAATNLEIEQRGVGADLRAIELSDAYQKHGRVIDLRNTLVAQKSTLAERTKTLEDSAVAAADRTRRSRVELDEAVTQLSEIVDRACGAGADPVTIDRLLGYRDRQRATYSVEYRVIDAGPGISVHHDKDGITALSASWSTMANRFQAKADLARILSRDHDDVAKAHAKAVDAGRNAELADRQYDEAAQDAQRAAEVARSRADDTLESVRAWAVEYPALRGFTDGQRPEAGPEHADDDIWDLGDVDEIAGSEPATVLASVEQWAEHAVTRAERVAAGLEQDAKSLILAAKSAESISAEHRAEAARLRGGQLLPLPRPEWSGAGDDSTAMGSALEWRPEVPDVARDLIELALSRAGVLGAQLDLTGAEATHWSVSAIDSPEVATNLDTVLHVDETHPLAGVARAVLSRIELTESVAPSTTPPTAGGPLSSGLQIGRDGTYAAGPLRADPAAALATDDAPIPAAEYIGARARREAAFRQAEQLEQLAAVLDSEARLQREQAAAATLHARQVRREARAFPPPKPLRDAESRRSQAAIRAIELAADATAARTAADAAAGQHREMRRVWVDRAAALELPADLDRLAELIRSQQDRAHKLSGAAGELNSRFTRTLTRVLNEVPDDTAIETLLAAQQSAARQTLDDVADTTALLDEITRGEDTDEVLVRHRGLTLRNKQIVAELEFAKDRQLTAIKAATAANTALKLAHDELNAIKPQQTATEGRLRSLLQYPPVSQVLSGTTDVSYGDELLELAESLLAARSKASRKTLGERYDRVRTELAQTWTIARAEPVEGLNDLELYELTHSEARYAPAEAAARATHLAQQARAALAEAEATALADFVIGRLPSAIGAAWIRLQDWKGAVNAKMRSAQASSGVGVQVEIPLSADLPPAARTVYELSCKVSDADRTAEQKEAVGKALSSLLDAADGENMLERLTAAVDIRSWVDVHYLVDRPGLDGRRSLKRWNSRTGLSGGERRLVVLAPMLASIAASYDRLGPEGLRLVPLDEVPAEVDERGREGLARYLAELDLDVLCTSYLWDGSPGAWDGIDAHDLEAGSEGTVVAFPMLVRGSTPIPGDDSLNRPSENIQRSTS